MEHTLLDTLERYENCRETLTDILVLKKRKERSEEELDGIGEAARAQLENCEEDLRSIRDRILHDAERYRLDYEKNCHEMKRLNREIEAGTVSYPDYEARYGKASQVARKARRYYNWWRHVLACKSSAELRLFLTEAGGLEDEVLMVDSSWVTLLSRTLCVLGAVILAMAVLFPWARTAHGEAPVLFALSTLNPAALPYWLYILLTAATAAFVGFAVPSRQTRGACSLAIALLLSLVGAFVLYQIRRDMPGEGAGGYGFAYVTFGQIFSLLEVGAYLFMLSVILLIAGAMIDLSRNGRALAVGVLLTVLVLGLDVLMMTLRAGTVTAKPELAWEQEELEGLMREASVQVRTPDGTLVPVDGLQVPLRIHNAGRVSMRLIPGGTGAELARHYQVILEHYDHVREDWVQQGPHEMDRQLLEGIIIGPDEQRNVRAVFAPTWPPTLSPFSQAGTWRIRLRSPDHSLSEVFHIPERSNPEKLGGYLYGRAQQLIEKEQLEQAQTVLRTLVVAVPAFSRIPDIKEEMVTLQSRIQLEEDARERIREIQTALNVEDEDPAKLVKVYPWIEDLQKRYGGTIAARKAEELYADYGQKALDRAWREYTRDSFVSAALVYPIAASQLDQDEKRKAAAVLRHAGRLLLEPTGREDREKANKYLLKAYRLLAGADLPEKDEELLTTPASLQLLPRILPAEEAASPGQRLQQAADFAFRVALSTTAPITAQIKRLRAFAEAFPKDERSPGVYLALGQACIYADVADWQQKCGQPAIDAFQTILRRAEEDVAYKPLVPDAREGLGIAFARLGRPLLALRWLYSVELPADWSEARRERMAARIAGIRDEIGWGTSLGDRLDRMEVEATIEANPLLIEKPELVETLTEDGKPPHRVVILTVATDKITAAQTETLRRWVRGGGTLWVRGSAARRFDLPVIEKKYRRAEASRTTSRGVEMLADHPMLNGVRDIICSGTHVVPRAAGILGRPMIEIVAGDTPQYVCWFAPMSKGKIIFLPNEIHRKDGNGSRFMLNLKLFSLDEDIPPTQ